MPSPLIQALQGFADPQSEAQLQALDAAVQAIEPSSLTLAECHAMLTVFERFPEEDGYGVFWAILHALEASTGYEPELLASVERKPCEFNVLMVNRLLNAKIIEVEGRLLEGVLRSVVLNPAATARAVHGATQYLARHEA